MNTLLAVMLLGISSIGCSDRAEKAELAKYGIKAEAEIRSVEQTNEMYNEYWVYRLQLKVMPENLPPYYTVVSEPFQDLHIKNLYVGGNVTVKYDPKDPKKVTVVVYRFS